jgi:hypothetical protein
MVDPPSQWVDERLDGDAGTAEARRAAHAFGVDPNDFVELEFLLRRHDLIISLFDSRRSAEAAD